MPTVADVMRRHGTAYLERFNAAMPAEHKKVLRTIMACRTGQLGTVLYRCVSCGRQHVMGRSCGNRHCPTCQQDKTRAWLETQTERLLPCPYFLLTFTVPAALCAWIRSHQRVAYAALFEASSEAIKTLTADPKYVGATQPGFLRCAAHVGAHSRLSPSRSLRCARRRHQCRRPDMAAIPCPFLRGGPSAVDPVSSQVPRCSRACWAVDRSRSRGVASRLGSSLAGRR